VKSHCDAVKKVANAPDATVAVINAKSTRKKNLRSTATTVFITELPLFEYRRKVPQCRSVPSRSFTDDYISLTDNFRERGKYFPKSLEKSRMALAD
jgi:hypothetical protein